MFGLVDETLSLSHLFRFSFHPHFQTYLLTFSFCTSLMEHWEQLKTNQKLFLNFHSCFSFSQRTVVSFIFHRKLNVIHCLFKTFGEKHNDKLMKAHAYSSSFRIVSHLMMNNGIRARFFELTATFQAVLLENCSPQGYFESFLCVLKKCTSITQPEMMLRVGFEKETESFLVGDECLMVNRR